MKIRYILYGMAFGFILSRAGATDYDAIMGMFRLTDLHLVGVIGTAVVLNAIAFAAFRRFRIPARNGEHIALAPKPMNRGVVYGALLFGVGWALAGTCPGTALSQIGEMKLSALATVAGMFAGVYAFEALARRRNAISRPAATPVAGAPQPEAMT